MHTPAPSTQTAGIEEGGKRNLLVVPENQSQLFVPGASLLAAGSWNGQICHLPTSHRWRSTRARVPRAGGRNRCGKVKPCICSSIGLAALFASLLTFGVVVPVLTGFSLDDLSIVMTSTGRKHRRQ